MARGEGCSYRDVRLARGVGVLPIAGVIGAVFETGTAAIAAVHEWEDLVYLVWGEWEGRWECRADVIVDGRLIVVEVFT